MATKGFCFTDIKAILGEDTAIDDTILREVLDEVDGLKGSANFVKQLEKAIKDKKTDAIRIGRDKIINEVKKAELTKFVLQEEFLKEGNYNSAFKAMAQSSRFHVEGGKFSYQNIRHTSQAKLLNYMDTAVGDLRPILKNKKFGKEITSAAFKHSRGQDISMHGQEVQKIAKSIVDIDKFAAIEAQNAGIIIDERIGHLWRQVHDQSRIMGAPKDEWVDFINRQDMLNHKESFGPHAGNSKRSKEILGDIYDDIIIGEYSVEGGGNVLNQRRQLHFLSGESMYEYNIKFGGGEVAENMATSLRATAKAIASHTKFGPHRVKLWKDLETTMFEAIKKKHGAKEAGKFRGGADFKAREAIRKQMFGYEETGTVNMATQILDGMQAVNASSKLMMSAPSTITDQPLTVFNYMAKSGKGFLESNVEVFSAYTKNMTAKQRKKFGKAMMVNADQDLDRFGATATVNGKLKSMSNAAMQASLMPHLTSINKATAAFTNAHGLGGDLTGAMKFDDLSPNWRKELKDFGIHEKDFDNLKKGVVDVDGERLLSPEAIEYDLKDRQLASRVGAFINNQVTVSSPATGLLTQSLVMGGHSPHSTMGKARAAMLQFKSFGIEVGGTLKEIGTSSPKTNATTFVEGMKDWDNAKTMGMLMVQAYGAASIGLWARDLVAGKTPRDMTQTDNIMEAWSRSVFPIQIQFILDAVRGEYENFGRSVLGDMAGPTFGQLDDAFRFVSKVGQGKDVSNDALRFWKNNMPLLKHPLLMPILNKWFLTSLSEHYAPGFVARQNARMQENDQQYLLDTTTPW